MGDSLLSPPLTVKTPYNKTDLDEFRDSLGLDEIKEELRGYADSGDQKLEAVVEAYAHSEDEQLETRVHGWVWLNRDTNLTLEGSNVGPDRGMVYYNGLPLCADDSQNHYTWDLDDATVVCRMLGFSKAAQYYIHCSTSYSGFCPPAGIRFAASGFKCTGSESHILDCPHDDTASSYCGSSGFTHSSGADIVGVECE